MLERFRYLIDPLRRIPNVYSELKADRILGTLEQLSDRIGERFPDSGLRQVSLELLAVARENQRLVNLLAQPIWPVRVATVLASALLIALGIAVFAFSLKLTNTMHGRAEFIQVLESALNETIFLALAVFTLNSLETRLKRRVALGALHRLRSIAHVVDMHQLTKDPAYLLAPTQPTASSPKRSMSKELLTRYLDYCSELLAITSKLAALHAQYLNDPVVLAAVNDVETLADGLARKVWQKITILDSAASPIKPS